MILSTEPRYFRVTEWDDTTAVVLACLAVRNKDVFVEYDDGTIHRVTRTHFVDELKATEHAHCWCGSNRTLEEPGWGQWPCCPDCGTV